MKQELTHVATAVALLGNRPSVNSASYRHLGSGFWKPALAISFSLAVAALAALRTCLVRYVVPCAFLIDISIRTRDYSSLLNPAASCDFGIFSFSYTSCQRTPYPYCPPAPRRAHAHYPSLYSVLSTVVSVLAAAVSTRYFLSFSPFLSLRPVSSQSPFPSASRSPVSTPPSPQGLFGLELVLFILYSYSLFLLYF